MHPIQKKLFKIIKEQDLSGMTLRDIGELVGEDHPQKISHHLNQLKDRGLISMSDDREIIRPARTTKKKGTKLVAVPIIGAADCGSPTALANELFEGYLRISDKLLKPRTKEEIFAIRAQGDSMNRSSINGKSIEDGDYVLIDGGNYNINNKDYVLVVVDEVAAIKKFIKEEDRVVLVSESSKDYPPIYLHPDDNFFINGKVIQVIKKLDRDWL